jgi:hypothetical protein
LKTPPSDGPAYLIYDIETAPVLAYVWGAYRQDILAIEQDWYLLSFAYKWLDRKGTGFVSIAQNPKWEPGSDDDLHVALRLAALFDRADVVVAHNGDRFDQKKANSRFLFHQIDPPSPYETIDTLKESRRYMAETKHSLGALADHYGLDPKGNPGGISLWLACMNGDPAAWRKMERYNRQDVRTLEQLYLRLRPWIGSPGKRAHPNRAHWQKGDLVCPKCGSANTIIRGWRRTIVSEYPTVFCRSCRGYSRLRERKSQRDGQFVRAL